jgi:hypothetical protein
MRTGTGGFFRFFKKIRKEGNPAFLHVNNIFPVHFEVTAVVLLFAKNVIYFRSKNRFEIFCGLVEISHFQGDFVGFVNKVNSWKTSYT